jgi:hypothetical protein
LEELSCACSWDRILQTCLKIQDKKVAMVQNSVVVFVNGRNQPRRAVYETSFFLGSITKTKTKTKTLAIFSSSNVYKGDRSVCISTVNFILVELRVGTKVWSGLSGVNPENARETGGDYESGVVLCRGLNRRR